LKTSIGQLFRVPRFHTIPGSINSSNELKTKHVFNFWVGQTNPGNKKIVWGETVPTLWEQLHDAWVSPAIESFQKQ